MMDVSTTSEYPSLFFSHFTFVQYIIGTLRGDRSSCVTLSQCEENKRVRLSSHNCCIAGPGISICPSLVDVTNCKSSLEENKQELLNSHLWATV